MAPDASQRDQRDERDEQDEQDEHKLLHYAIVDEVDNILIDEARTPLIISGAVRRSRRLRTTGGSRRFVARAMVHKVDDFAVDDRKAALGIAFPRAASSGARNPVAGREGNLYDPENSTRLVQYLPRTRCKAEVPSN